MFELAGATAGDRVTANDVGVIVKLYGQSSSYLFHREFYDEFERYLSDRIDAAEFDPREDFETPHEHLERIKMDIETVDFDADGVWVF
jgi:hypothetical protein